MDLGPEFMELLEEDLSGALLANKTQPPPSTIQAIVNTPVKTSSDCNNENPSIPINTHYVEITDDHRALAAELEKYTCPPLELLDKGANAFLTLVTGVQWGEPYRRRKASESSCEDDEETVQFPRVELFTYDGESDSEKKKKKSKQKTVRLGPERDERSPKQLNRMFPLPDMGESPFVKRMKMLKTNCANVLFMEHLEAMNERVEALEQQLQLVLSQVPPAPEITPSQYAKPSNPIEVKKKESSTSSKSDDFEVVGESGKSLIELQAALVEAQKQIAEADKRSDEFAERYNNLGTSMSEAMMNAARFTSQSLPAPINAEAKGSSSNSKSDDFEVVSPSGKSLTELEAALAEAQRQIIEADTRSDEFAERYNNLVASMSEAMMNAAR